MRSQVWASIPGNRFKCARFVVAMVTISPGWPASAVWPAKMASASRESADDVGRPVCRRNAQNSAALMIASVVRTRCRDLRRVFDGAGVRRDRAWLLPRAWWVFIGHGQHPIDEPSDGPGIPSLFLRGKATNSPCGIVARHGTGRRLKRLIRRGRFPRGAGAESLSRIGLPANDRLRQGVTQPVR